jgi:NAD(P)-dependent dehydrogenase (short-subunit alcohol dehydrogenase family)
MVAGRVSVPIPDLGTITAPPVAHNAARGAQIALGSRVTRINRVYKGPASASAQRAKNSAGAGGTDILMNNAGIQPGSQMFGPHENWQRILSVDLWGVINGSQAFAPQIIARGLPGSGTADLANQRSGDHSTWSR